jgi:hypothetical protein
MPLINTSVTNMIQGVSQQPDSVRFAGQCDEQLNALSSVVDGLKKRPNTKHVVRMFESAISDKSFVHFINRDDEEKYVVILDKTNNKLAAFNTLTGARATINGAADVTIGASDYLNAANPYRDIKALTVADNTFLLNSSVVAQASEVLTPSRKKQALVSITQGDYEKTYRINAGESAYIYLSVTANVSGGSRRVHTIKVIHGGYQVAIQTFKFYHNGSVLPTTVTGDGSGVVTNITVNNPVWRSGTNYNYTWDWLSVENDLNSTPTSTLPAQHDWWWGSAYHVSGTANASGLNADTTVISTNLASVCNGSTTKLLGTNGSNVFLGPGIHNNFTTTRSGNTLALEWKSGGNQDFTMSADDPLGGAGMSVAYKEVDSITALPLEAPNGFNIKIVGDAEIDQDDYYVDFNTSSGAAFGQGTWKEGRAPDIEEGMNNDTMPMSLVNISLNAFELKTIEYEKRLVGDDDSNPHPSFEGKKINAMFFFKNRLGMLTSDSVILSEAGKFFNFYRLSVSSLLDSAPIDVNVSSTRVTQLAAAVGFQENLLIFGDNVQFVMKGGELLTPQTVSVSPVTNFSFDTHDTPLVLGSYVYFPFSRGSYTGVREYTVNANTDTYDSAEITEHVPAYIPRELVDTAGTTAENAYAVVSQNERNAIYFYKYFWENNTKALSSWSKFTVDGEIRGIEFLESQLVMVVVRDSQTLLLTMSINSGQTSADPYLSAPTDFEDLQILLDNRIEMRRLANSNDLQYYNGTAWVSAASQLPYKIASADAGDYKFIDDDGNVMDVSYGTTAGFSITGTPTTGSFTYGYLGKLYNMKYKFSTQLFKAAAGKSSSPSAASSLIVRNGAVFYDNTNSFDVKIETDQRNIIVSSYHAEAQPNNTDISGVKFGDGFFRFAVHGKAKNTEMTIESLNPFDCKFNSAEFESFVKPRSSRYG